MTKDDIIVKKQSIAMMQLGIGAAGEYILNSVTQSLQRRWKMGAERRDTFAGR